VTVEILLLIVPVFAMAVLYSSVGHGGASGYIAVMTLMGMSVVDIRPIALVMNIAVATLVVIRFSKHDHFSWKLFLPFAIASVPMAYIGGAVNISIMIIKIITGISLLIVACYIFINKHQDIKIKKAHFISCLLIGLLLGYLSGLTGVGGAIYLSPIIYFMRWADMHRNAAVSGAFVLVNSLAGLIGYSSNNFNLPSELSIFVLIAIFGALIGTYFGINKFKTVVMKKLLAFVLMIAGGKLIFSAVI